MAEETLDQSAKSDSDGITEKMVSSIKTTVPWMKFISIFNMIFVILGLIVGLISFFMTFHWVVFVYLLIYGLVLYVLINLLNSANAYTRFISSKNTADLEGALSNQAKFWKITGIMIVVTIVLSIISAIYIANAGNEFYEALSNM